MWTPGNKNRKLYNTNNLKEKYSGENKTLENEKWEPKQNIQIEGLGDQAK